VGSPILLANIAGCQWSMFEADGFWLSCLLWQSGAGNTKGGTSCLTGLESVVWQHPMTTDNVCIYLQNRLIHTSQTGGQWYSDTSPFSIPWLGLSVLIEFAYGAIFWLTTIWVKTVLGGVFLAITLVLGYWHEKETNFLSNALLKMIIIREVWSTIINESARDSSLSCSCPGY